MGYGGYDKKQGNTTVYGNDIKFSSITAGLSGRSFGVNKVLWSGSNRMGTDQKISLSEAISAQPNGIILGWSYVTTESYNWNYTFIPKYHALSRSGNGVDCVLATTGSVYHKYVYPTDTSITGHEKNGQTSVSFESGNKDMSYFALRVVIGV